MQAFGTSFHHVYWVHPSHDLQLQLILCCSILQQIVHLVRVYLAHRDYYLKLVSEREGRWRVPYVRTHYIRRCSRRPWLFVTEAGVRIGDALLS